MGRNRGMKGSVEQLKKRDGSTHRVLSLWAHQPRLQHVQRLTQECSAASLQRNSSSVHRRALQTCHWLPGLTNTSRYLRQWSWTESVWVCYLPSCLFPGRAAWPGRNTPTKGAEEMEEEDLWHFIGDTNSLGWCSYYSPSFSFASGSHLQV